MKKTITLIIALLFLQLSYSQDYIDMSYFPQKEAIVYQLDILSQKLIDGKFQTTKTKRFVLKVIDDYTIETQKVYDTLYGKTPMNEEIKYEYYRGTSNNLRKMSFYDFKGNLKKETQFNYDENSLLSNELTYDEKGEDEGEITIATTYEDCKCKAAFIKGLSENPIAQDFDCFAKTIEKKVSGYKTTEIRVSFKEGFNTLRELNLKGDKDGVISNYYNNYYDDNDRLIRVELVTNGKTRPYITYKYNERGDLISKKSFGTLLYEYAYDDNGDWVEKIETSANKKKRTVYKRTYKFE